MLEARQDTYSPMYQTNPGPLVYVVLANKQTTLAYCLSGSTPHQMGSMLETVWWVRVWGSPCVTRFVKAPPAMSSSVKPIVCATRGIA